MARPRKAAYAYRGHKKPEFTYEDVTLAGAAMDWTDKHLEVLDAYPQLKALFIAERDAWIAAGRPPLPDWTNWMCAQWEVAVRKGLPWPPKPEWLTLTKGDE